MKFDKFEENDVQLLMDDEESIEFGIDQQDDWIIFKSFINYSNPISAVVREIVSNAYDAHIEAGVERDVEVEITERNDLTGASDSFIVRDYGPGISQQRMKEIYSKFGKSTKRNTNNEIGAFGFGAKSPLGYNDMFEMITYVDGTKFHYAIHKGERRPKITLMHHEPTDRENGTTIKVAIKPGDVYSFRSHIKESLRYFDNITYKNCNMDNDYVLIKKWGAIFRFVDSKQKADGKKIFTTPSDNRDLDLCLGKVSYPIDRSADLTEYRMSGGLYFDVGDIPIVWNRESVEYTKDSIKKIQESAQKLSDKLEQEYAQSRSKIVTIEDLFEADRGFSYGGKWLVVHKTKDAVYKVRVDKMIPTETRHPKYKPLKVTRTASLAASVARVYKHLTTGYERDNFHQFSWKHEKDNVTWYYADTMYQMPKMTAEYIKQRMNNTYVIKLSGSWKQCRRSLLNLVVPGINFTSAPFNVDKELRQQYIAKAKELYHQMRKEIKQLPNINTLKVPESFENDFKQQQLEKKQRQKEKFSYMRAAQNGSFSRNQTQGSELKRRFKNERVIYGFQADRKLLRDIKKIVHNELSIKAKDFVNVIQISQRNERVIKEELGDKATYCKHISKLPMFERIGNSYNLSEYARELHRDMQNDRLFSKIMDTLNYRVYNASPSYIEPSEPTKEEINELYTKIGNKLKYPLLNYTGYSTPPKELQETYKEQCPLHHIHPVLVTKKYIKHYEETTNSTEE